MEVAELDEALKVLDSSLSLIKWRLKSQSRRRLEIDILALCTGMRPVVMIDYGGKMPEPQERLCALIKLTQKNLGIVVWEDGKPRTRINKKRLRQKRHTLESFVKEFSKQT